MRVAPTTPPPAATRVMMFAVTLAAAVPAAAVADTFVVRTSRTEADRFEARVYGEKDGVLTLIRPSGKIEAFREGAVVERTPGLMAPLSGEVMIERLTERFGGPDRFIAVHQKAFVVGIQLESPIEDRRTRALVPKLLNKSAKFMNEAMLSFTRFANRMGLPAEEPEFPLVMVIFENDDLFEAYTREELADTFTGKRLTGLNGFYSHGANWLAVRLTECDDFALPLHEGVHQQVYNRGWNKRFAPIPTWFAEGIATGFEADGLDVDTDPRQISPRYATQLSTSSRVGFDTIIRSDDAFDGDVLVGEAYARAWGLHWMLVTTRAKQYTDYVKMLSTREPREDMPADREAIFGEVFGTTASELSEQFPKTLDAAARRQRVRPKRPSKGGIRAEQNLGQIDLKMQGRGGVMRAGGTIRNKNPLRPLVFRVTATPEIGSAIVWVTPPVPPGATAKLPVQQAAAPSGTSIGVQIESASEEAAKSKGWPVPGR